MSNTYQYRNAMRKNLIADKRLTGTKEMVLQRSLVSQSKLILNYIFYRIIQTKLGEVLSLHSKILLIEFADDSTLKFSKIHE